MYTPAAFGPPDENAMLDLMERHSFALLLSHSATGMVASHLPLLLDRHPSPRGTLLGHMARANAQWRTAAGQEVLVVFSGPHAYISPAWYEAPRTVPTWNYVAAHAYGKLVLIEDSAEAESLLRRTVKHFEGPLDSPWQLNEPAEFVAPLVEQIVAFSIPIDRLEGKWKLNQNHPAERRRKVIAALEKQDCENSHAIARLMQAMLSAE
jgi:transcriptional regulator